MILTICDVCGKPIKGFGFRFGIWEVGKATKNKFKAAKKGHICQKCMTKVFGVVK